MERTKNFLVEHGVPADHFETRSFGKEDQLTADQIKELIAQNPDLSPADRQQMLNNLQVLVLANNRRVDVTLSTTGQQCTRLYPFNANFSRGRMSFVLNHVANLSSHFSTANAVAPRSPVVPGEGIAKWLTSIPVYLCAPGKLPRKAFVCR